MKLHLAERERKNFKVGFEWDHVGFRGTEAGRIKMNIKEINGR